MSYEGWAIVEILGHRRHVGRISEETHYGAAMCRVKVPDGHKAGWREELLYSGGSIFGISPCTEDYARRANTPWDQRPNVGQPLQLTRALVEEANEGETDECEP